MYLRAAVWTILLFAIATAPAAAGAAGFTGIKLADGTPVQYAVALPDGFDAKKTYPAILALPPDRQGNRAVRAGLSRIWEAEAKRRGYIVISPVAPDKQLFFQGGERIFPEFLDRMLKMFPVQGEQFHLTGISNGGRSAFHIAQRHPKYFRSPTVLPGFPPPPVDPKNLAKLKNMKIQMYVGENDQGWRRRMVAAKAELDRLGVVARFEIMPGQGHRIQSLAGPNAKILFDRLAN